MGPDGCNVVARFIHMASATFWNSSPRLSHDWVMLSISERNNHWPPRYLFISGSRKRQKASERSRDGIFFKRSLSRDPGSKFNECLVVNLNKTFRSDGVARGGEI
jgi:hypothetical protein